MSGPPLAVKWGWGATGPVQLFNSTSQATQVIESPAGGISRIRHISVFAETGANGASSLPIQQIPLIVLRGGPTLGASYPVVLDITQTYNQWGLPTAAQCPYEILLARLFQVRFGDTSQDFSENELIAYDGDRLAIISFFPFDASGVTAIPVSQTIFGHSTLGDDIPSGVIQDSYIAGHYGKVHSLPRYDVPN